MNAPRRKAAQQFCETGRTQEQRRRRKMFGAKRESSILLVAAWGVHLSNSSDRASRIKIRTFYRLRDALRGPGKRDGGLTQALRRAPHAFEPGNTSIDCITDSNTRAAQGNRSRRPHSGTCRDRSLPSAKDAQQLTRTCHRLNENRQDQEHSGWPGPGGRGGRFCAAVGPGTHGDGAERTENRTAVFQQRKTRPISHTE